MNLFASKRSDKCETYYQVNIYFSACGCYYKLHKTNRPLTMVKNELRTRKRKARNPQGKAAKIKHSPKSEIHDSNSSFDQSK